MPDVAYEGPGPAVAELRHAKRGERWFTDRLPSFLLWEGAIPAGFTGRGCYELGRAPVLLLSLLG